MFHSLSHTSNTWRGRRGEARARSRHLASDAEHPSSRPRWWTVIRQAPVVSRHVSAQQRPRANVIPPRCATHKILPPCHRSRSPRLSLFRNGQWTMRVVKTKCLDPVVQFKRLLLTDEQGRLHGSWGKKMASLPGKFNVERRTRTRIRKIFTWA
jgi:hypothetical protein